MLPSLLLLLRRLLLRSRPPPTSGCMLSTHWLAKPSNIDAVGTCNVATAAPTKPHDPTAQRASATRPHLRPACLGPVACPRCKAHAHTGLAAIPTAHGNANQRVCLAHPRSSSIFSASEWSCPALGLVTPLAAGRPYQVSCSAAPSQMQVPCMYCCQQHVKQHVASGQRGHCCKYCTTLRCTAPQGTSDLAHCRGQPTDQGSVLQTRRHKAHSRASYRPHHSRASNRPHHSRASYRPHHSRASYRPHHSRASYRPHHSDALMPMGGRRHHTCTEAPPVSCSPASPS
jgi:hypothetical protein